MADDSCTNCTGCPADCTHSTCADKCALNQNCTCTGCPSHG